MSNSKSAPLPSLPRMLTLNNPQMTWPDPQAAEEIEQKLVKMEKWNEMSNYIDSAGCKQTF